MLILKLKCYTKISIDFFSIYIFLYVNKTLFFKQFRVHTIGNRVVKKINSHNHELSPINKLRNVRVENTTSSSDDNAKCEQENLVKNINAIWKGFKNRSLENCKFFLST